MRFAIFGNSGSGKSTLAGWLAERMKLPVLDLDTIAWMPDQVAVPRPVEEAMRDLESFCRSRPSWIVEGCYANLIEQALKYRPMLLFLNPGVEVCIAHCRARPWERHKFASKAEQDSHLSFLLDWVRDYDVRTGELSLAGHRDCFGRYDGEKVEICDRLELDEPPRFLLEIINLAGG